MTADADTVRREARGPFNELTKSFHTQGLSAWRTSSSRTPATTATSSTSCTTSSSPPAGTSGSTGRTSRRRRTGSRTSTTRSTRPRASSSSSAPSSLASEYCAAELAHAQKGGKRVVPIAIDGADPAAAPTGAAASSTGSGPARRDDRAAAFEALGARARHRPRVVARAHAPARARGRVGRAEGRRACCCAAGTWRRPSASWRRTRARTRARRSSSSSTCTRAAAPRRGGSGRCSAASRRRSSSRSRSASSRVLQRNTANDRARVAESKTLSLQSVDALATAPATALAHAVEAFETSRDARGEARAAAGDPREPDRAVDPGGQPARPERRSPALAWSADGTRLLGADTDGHVARLEQRERPRRARRRAADARRARAGRPRALRARADDPARRAARPRRCVTRPGRADRRRSASPARSRSPLVAGGGTAARARRRDRRAGPARRRSVSADEAVFSPDGTRVVTLGSATRVWDTRSGRLLATLPPASVAAISRDGRLRRDRTGRPRHRAVVGRAREGGSPGSPTSLVRVVFSPTGDLLVTVEPGRRDDDPAHEQRPARSGRCRAPAAPTSPAATRRRSIPDAAFSPDGRLARGREPRRHRPRVGARRPASRSAPSRPAGPTPSRSRRATAASRR